MGSKMKVKLANTQDVPEGKGIVVKGQEGMDIALFKCEGKIYAMENTCPHMGGPLGEGQLEDCIVTCPWHGWQFDVRTGACENMPGDDARHLDVTVIGDEIYLNGD